MKGQLPLIPILGRVFSTLGISKILPALEKDAPLAAAYIGGLLSGTGEVHKIFSGHKKGRRRKIYKSPRRSRKR